MIYVNIYKLTCKSIHIEKIFTLQLLLRAQMCKPREHVFWCYGAHEALKPARYFKDRHP